MIFILLLIAFISVFSAFVPEKYQKYGFAGIALVQFYAFYFFMQQLPHVNAGEVVRQEVQWIAEIGLQLSFTLDSLSIIFALLITGIGFLVFLFAGPYMKHYSHTGRFYLFLGLFSSAMLGLVLSGNAIMMFIFWELTSALSFLLISFFHEKEKARKAAFQALYTTGLGGLLLLTGFIMLGSITSSFDFDVWAKSTQHIKASGLYVPALLFIFTGAFTKSAQFPFHFWLPCAMQAPGPVSAYLHSATMVKAGIFLLFKLNPILGGTNVWIYVLPFFGLATMFLGAYFSITQTDLKAVLAYTTLSALGLLVLLIGIDTNASMKAALVFLLVHALYKAALFMIAGFIDKKTGTRDIDLIGKLAFYMPLTFVFAFLALLSMAGLPPLLGFVGKELVYDAKAQLPSYGTIILLLGVLSNIFLVAVSFFLIFKLFLESGGETPKKANEKGILFWVGPAVLTSASLLFGIFPGTLNSIIEPALSIIQAEKVSITLHMWHGFNFVFFLSFFTVVSGIALAVFLIKNSWFVTEWRKYNALLFAQDASAIFQNIIDGFVAFSRRKLTVIQHGKNRLYIMAVILVSTTLLWLQVYLTRGWELNYSSFHDPFYVIGIIVIIIAATIYSTIAPSRIVTIIVMGVVGYGISLIFFLYSAVDLAITQILSETLIIILFVQVLQKLPRFARLSSTKAKIRDLFIALGFGSVMTVLALKAINVNFQRPISSFFIEKSLAEAHGKNVVNVILVDFRALDTMGEVLVLAVAALGISIMLKRRTRNVNSKSEVK